MASQAKKVSIKAEAKIFPKMPLKSNLNSFLFSLSSLKLVIDRNSNFEFRPKPIPKPKLWPRLWPKPKLKETFQKNDCPAIFQPNSKAKV